MRSAVLWFAALAFAVSSWANAAEDLTPEKRAEIRQLIAITGGPMFASQAADATTQNLAKMLRTSRPDIPDSVFAAVNLELRSLFEERMDAPGGLVERMVPVYHEHFTHTEVTQLIAFYQTPLGRKMTDALPQVVTETMRAGQAWGRSLGPEIQKRVAAVLKKEGIVMPRKK